MNSVWVSFFAGDSSASDGLRFRFQAGPKNTYNGIENLPPASGYMPPIPAIELSDNYKEKSRLSRIFDFDCGFVGKKSEDRKVK
jgi:hypothetical protein